MVTMHESLMYFSIALTGFLLIILSQCATSMDEFYQPRYLQQYTSTQTLYQDSSFNSTMDSKPPEPVSSSINPPAPDSYPPYVRITSPDEGDWTSADTILVGYVDSIHALQKIEYQLNNQPYLETPILPDNTFEIALTVLPQDTHQVIVRATNIYGLNGTDAIFFEVDNTKPSIVVTEPTPNRKVGGLVPVYGTAGDSHSGLSKVYVALDDGEGELASGKSNWSYTLDTFSFTPGNYTLRIWAMDKVGNSSAVQSFQITVESNTDIGPCLNADVNKNAFDPSITFYDGTPYVAFIENNNTPNILKVVYYDGSAWQQIGDPLNADPALPISGPSIGMWVDAPIVAYRELVGSTWELIVKQWDGVSTWNQLGSALNNNASNHAWDIELYAFPDAINKPYVVWREIDNGTSHFQIYCKQWNGTTWNMLASNVGCHTSSNCYHPSITYIGTIPYVAFNQNNHLNSDFVRVRYYEGSVWKTLGPELNFNPTERAFEPNINTYNSRPYVAWAEEIGDTRQIYTAYWDGVAWIFLGESMNLDSQQNAFDPVLQFNSGIPYVSFLEQRNEVEHLIVRKYESNSWNTLGGHYWNLAYHRSILKHDMVLGNGKPYLVFTEQADLDAQRVYVRSTTP